jgi:hypothetical protein
MLKPSLKAYLGVRFSKGVAFERKTVLFSYQNPSVHHGWKTVLVGKENGFFRLHNAFLVLL